MTGTEKVVVAVSQDAETFIRYGDEKMVAGAAAEAVQFYNKALATQPGYAKALHRKANALEMDGQIEDAIATYGLALAADPTDAECWFNRGVILKKAGQTAEGNSCIDTGVQIAMGSA
jgi:Flp pilus assembly protein TadD